MLASLTVMTVDHIWTLLLFQDLDSTAETAEIHSPHKTKRD